MVIQNLQLSQVLHEVIILSDMLENVDFKQIYRERNSKSDELAKVGATILDGDLVICLMTMVVFVEHVCSIWDFIIL